jgi:small subunit ribosomal protein S6
MTLPAPTYDLVLLLDLQAEPDERAKVVADARAAIEAQGEFLRHDEWGERVLAYPIDKKANAEYHLLQFHTTGAELLDTLEHSLRITDGVLRFRMIKLAPGVPDAPDMRSSAAPRSGETESAPAAEAPVAAEPAAVAAEPVAATAAVEALAEPVAGDA